MTDLPDYERAAYIDLLKKEQAYERQVGRVLRDALTQMYGEMQHIYDKYASGGVLTKAEMTRYNRLASVETQLLSILGPAITKTKGLIQRIPAELYGASFFRYAWAVDVATGLRLSWGLLNKDAIMENLANPFDKISMERYPVNARLNIRTALNQGLSAGKSYTAMAKGLKDAINKTYYEATRTIWTEGHTAIEAGQADLYDKATANGIDGAVKWNATLDGRTREDHASMDGQERDVDGMFHFPDGELAPYPGYAELSAAERIHCRCAQRFEIAGYSPQLRRTREAGVVPYQSYETWSKGRKMWR